MKNSNNKKQIIFTYLSEKDEYELKIGDQIYESEDKCFLEVEDELNDVLISELPKDVEFQTSLSDTNESIDLAFRRDKNGFVKVDVTLRVYPKYWFGDIGYEVFLDAYSKMLPKVSTFSISDINKEIEVDRPSLNFALEFEANYVIDLFNTLREIDVKIQNEISKAVGDTLIYFWRILLNETEGKSE